MRNSPCAAAAAGPASARTPASPSAIDVTRDDRIVADHPHVRGVGAAFPRPAARGADFVADQHARQPIADLVRRKLAGKRQGARAEDGVRESVAGRAAGDAAA